MAASSPPPPASPVASGIALWSTPEWRATALQWLDRQLGAAGIERTGPPEQPHLRPWATALCVPTTHGSYWLKAAAAGTAFEIRLYPLLQRAVPRWVLEPLAVDLERSWVLLPDGGTLLGNRVPEAELEQAWLQVLPRYAELQLELAPHAAEMLALGLADMRAAVLPQRLEEALRIASDYVQREGDAQDTALLERVRAHAPSFARCCARLAAAPGPVSLDHNDLHPWNVFVASPTASLAELQVKFYDWGDAVLAHAFASLLVPLSQLRERLQLPGDARIVRLREAYLEPFGAVAPHADLIEAVELACHAAKVARALTWARALRTLNPTEAHRHARAPLRWLGYLLEERYLGMGG